MNTLVIDQPVTRRKRWHFVTDASGHAIYSSHKVSECLAFVREHEMWPIRLIGQQIDVVITQCDNVATI